MTGDGELLARVRKARRHLSAIGPVRVRADGDFERVSLPRSDADALRDRLLEERPRTVIEIGLAYASSALAIAEALAVNGVDGARHLIVGPYQDRFGNVGWTLLVRSGLDGLCSLIEEPSPIVLPRLLAEGYEADAAFVDGSHTFHNVFVDLSYLRELVRPGGVIILDDYDWPSVATAARYFERNTGWKVLPVAESSRLRAYRMPNPSVRPSLESFSPFGLDAPAGQGAAPERRTPARIEVRAVGLEDGGQEIACRRRGQAVASYGYEFDGPGPAGR